MPNSGTRDVIIVSPEPKGHFIEGVISGTGKPGICMSLKSTVRTDGQLEYEAWNGAADGERDEVIVLLPDWGQGKTVDDAYADGDHIFMYIPFPGDELAMRLANIGTGTGAGEEDVALGQKFIVKDGTGFILKTTGSPESEPFKCVEAVNDIEEDTLVVCRYTGN